MKLPNLSVLPLLVSLTTARFVAYIDQTNNATLPPTDLTGGIDHVILAFVQSAMLYNESSIVKWWDLPTIKSHFKDGTTFMVSIGGDPDFKEGFHKATESDDSQKDYAKKIADFVKREGFDGVDIDWKYPGGITGNETQEIKGFLPLLQAIKGEIGKDKTLSIASPGSKQYMYAYTKDLAPKIFETVDFLNILTEDQMDVFSNVTGYLTGITSCNETISDYLELGMPASKGTLGMPFYGQGYSVESDCKDGLGCKVVKAGEKKGDVVGKTADVMWTAAFLGPAPKDASEAGKGDMCGPSTQKKCPGNTCCSPAGYCGSTEDYCGWNCLPSWGHCNGSTSIGSFDKARNDKHAITDEGAYYFDKDASFFWTWDPAERYSDKYNTVVAGNQLGGVMVWSLGEDSYDWSHLKKLNEVIEEHDGR
ncbi:hypothetical protein KEM56_000466 [Ascosphaera pollenicola]|nr:hypothetical protein KEM56_000466 [Ascosphaera pollenicola]